MMPLRQTPQPEQYHGFHSCSTSMMECYAAHLQCWLNPSSSECLGFGNTNSCALFNMADLSVRAITCHVDSNVYKMRVCRSLASVCSTSVTNLLKSIPLVILCRAGDIIFHKRGNLLYLTAQPSVNTIVAYAHVKKAVSQGSNISVWYGPTINWARPALNVRMVLSVGCSLALFEEWRAR
jgi:hypothetical protein